MQVRSPSLPMCSLWMGPKPHSVLQLPAHIAAWHQAFTLPSVPPTTPGSRVERSGCCCQRCLGVTSQAQALCRLRHMLQHWLRSGPIGEVCSTPRSPGRLPSWALGVQTGPGYQPPIPMGWEQTAGGVSSPYSCPAKPGEQPISAAWRLPPELAKGCSSEPRCLWGGEAGRDPQPQPAVSQAPHHPGRSPAVTTGGGKGPWLCSPQRAWPSVAGSVLCQSV